VPYDTIEQESLQDSDGLERLSHVYRVTNDVTNGTRSSPWRDRGWAKAPSAGSRSTAIKHQGAGWADTPIDAKGTNRYSRPRPSR